LEGCSVQGSGRRIIGIEAGRVELIHWIDDAASEKFRPQVIHGGAGKLRIGGDDARHGLAIRFAGVGGLAREGVDRRHCLLRSHGLARRPVAGGGVERVVLNSGRVVHHGPIIGLAVDGVGNGRAGGGGVRHERSKAPGLGTRGLSAPQAESVQMIAAVVAQQTVHMRDAEKSLGDIGRFLIDVVLLWIADHPGSDEPVELALRVGVGAIIGDELGGHLVVGLAEISEFLIHL
jgi:hypothetical protein